VRRPDTTAVRGMLRRAKLETADRGRRWTDNAKGPMGAAGADASRAWIKALRRSPF